MTVLTVNGSLMYYSVQGGEGWFMVAVQGLEPRTLRI
jgi:hypothetical protein